MSKSAAGSLRRYIQGSPKGSLALHSLALFDSNLVHLYFNLRTGLEIDQKVQTTLHARGIIVTQTSWG